MLKDIYVNKVILGFVCLALAGTSFAYARVLWPSKPQWRIVPALGGGVHLCLAENGSTSCGDAVTIQHAVEYAIDNGAREMSFAHGVYDASIPKSAYAWLPVPKKDNRERWVWAKDWRR